MSNTFLQEGGEKITRGFAPLVWNVALRRVGGTCGKGGAKQTVNSHFARVCLKVVCSKTRAFPVWYQQVLALVLNRYPYLSCWSPTLWTDALLPGTRNGTLLWYLAKMRQKTNDWRNATMKESQTSAKNS